MGNSTSRNNASRNNASRNNTNAASPAMATEDIAVGVPVAETTSTAVPASSAKKLDLVFTIDCTGSMGSYIQAAKQGITRITERLAQAEGYDLRFGLVAYRDHPPQDSSYVTKSYAFTNDLADMQQNLASLSANGGGDGPEAVAAALKATYDVDWREDAAKIVVLIADAPPHGLGESGDGFPDGGPDGVDPLVVLDQMSAKGITIYSVGCQPALSSYRFATEFFIAVAERTNGQAVALGSAAALADVILGASVEEMDLEALTNEVQQLAAQMRSVEPALTDEAVEQRVWHSLSAKGTKTRQMGGSRLRSAHAGLVSAAPSLACAKASLAEKGPPPSLPQGLSSFRASMSARGGGPSMGLKKLPVRGGARRRSASPSSPITRSIRLDAVDGVDDEDDLLAELEASSLSVDADAAVFRGVVAMPACAAAAPPPSMVMRGAAAEERVALEEDTISMEQVSRLYGRGKKKGLW